MQFTSRPEALDKTVQVILAAARYGQNAQIRPPKLPEAGPRGQAYFNSEWGRSIARRWAEQFPQVVQMLADFAEHGDLPDGASERTVAESCHTVLGSLTAQVTEAAEHSQALAAPRIR